MRTKWISIALRGTFREERLVQRASSVAITDQLIVLRHGRTSGTAARGCRGGRMRRRKRRGQIFNHLRSRCADPNIDDIDNRVPVAAKLANLLRIHFEQEISAEGAIHGSGVQVRDINSAARDRSQDAHQCALRIAILNMKCVHVFLPKPWTKSSRAVTDPYSSSNNISESAAP